MNTPSNAIVPVNQEINPSERHRDFSLSSMPISQLLGQLAVVQECMKYAMVKDRHYGTIPGCGDKPALFKEGAEKLAFMFRMAPSFTIEERNLDRGHREYRITCTMRQIGSGIVLGEGVGCASTMEGKWRFRTGPVKLTERLVPKEYWDTKRDNPPAAQAIIGKGNTPKKGSDGLWYIAEGGGEKIEHDNPSDYYNTILKMAKKRAQVDATLTCTAASDCFAQDLEEILDATEIVEAQILEKEEAKKPSFSRTETTTAPERSEPPKQVERQAPAQPTDRKLQAGETIWEEDLLDVTERAGSTNGKPWTIYTLDFDGGRKATTFDGTLAEEAVNRISGRVKAIVKAGKKSGSWDFLGFASSNNSPSEERDENGDFRF
jgi:hypothetical protein